MPSKGRILRCSTCFAVRGAGRALGSLSPGNGRRYSGGGRGAKRRRSWGGNKCVIVMRARVASGATKLKRLQDHALKHTRSRKREKDQLCRSEMRSQRHSVCFQRLPWGRERDVTELSKSAERRMSITRAAAHIHTSETRSEVHSAE